MYVYTCMSTIRTKGGYHVLVYNECMCFEPAVLRFYNDSYLNIAHVFTAVLHTISHAYTGWSEEDSGAEEGSPLSNRGTCNYDSLLKTTSTVCSPVYMQLSLQRLASPSRGYIVQLAVCRCQPITS